MRRDLRRDLRRYFRIGKSIRHLESVVVGRVVCA